MTSPTTSVIVPAWNGRAVLPACLDALVAQSPAPDEIILIDDGSEDGTFEWASSEYPSLDVHRHERTVGFVHTVNKGLRLAAGELLVLLNQDTIVQPGWLSALSEASATPDVAIVGCHILNRDGSVQQCGGGVDMRGDTTNHVHATLTPSEGPRESEWVTGASLAITRQALETIGPLDEGFAPAYYEDVEWCTRARAEGFSVLYMPSSAVIHLEESRLHNDTAAFMRLYHGNRLRLVFKHWPIAALEEAFWPAERAWLERLGPGGERLVVVMQQLYLHYMLTLDRLWEWRRPREDTEAASGRIMSLLTDLYGVIPVNVPQVEAPSPVRISMVGGEASELRSSHLPPLPDQAIRMAAQTAPDLPPTHPGIPPPSAPLAPQPEPPPTPLSEEPAPAPSQPSDESSPLGRALLAPIDALLQKYEVRHRQQVDHALNQQGRRLEYQEALLRHEMKGALAQLNHELRHADAQERHKTFELLAHYHHRIRRATETQHQALAEAIVELHSSLDRALAVEYRSLVDALNQRLAEANDAWHASLEQARNAERHQREQAIEVLHTYVGEQARATAQLAQQVVELQRQLSAEREAADDPTRPD